MRLSALHKRFWDGHVAGLCGSEIAKKNRKSKSHVNKTLLELKKVFLAWKW